jgi:hypothetical protein
LGDAIRAVGSDVRSSIWFRLDLIDNLRRIVSSILIVCGVIDWTSALVFLPSPQEEA